MQTKEDKVLTPVGRIVSGSLYNFSTKDYNNKPLLDDDGKPYVEYFFALAIPKGSETSWEQTEWGSHIAVYTQKLYGGQIPQNFTWKINDGDSQIPNAKGTRNCDKEGFARHWILSFKSRFPAPIFDCGAPGMPALEVKDAVLPGDWVQVRAGLARSKKIANPTHFLNQEMVGFIKHGERIHTFELEDPNEVFQAVQPSTPASVLGVATSVYVPPVNAVTPIIPTVPHTQILNPPAFTPPPPVAPPAKQMTALAQGAPYEAWIQKGWTDASLIVAGYMTP